MGSRGGRPLTEPTELDTDPDIMAESLSAIAIDAPPTGAARSPALLHHVPLNVVAQGHRPNAETRRLVAEVGGLAALRRMTNNFYKKSFADPHIDKLIRSHEDPHGERFATWVAEKLGDETPWSDARRTRPQCPVSIGHGHTTVVHDRSSAHFAAWHSPKREEHKWGDHFNLEVRRIWMPRNS